MQIPDKLKLFMNGPHGINMGTRDANLKPEYHRVLGIRYVDNKHIHVFFDKDSGGRTIENLKDNQLVSVVLCSFENYESYQFKGKSKSVREANPEELLEIEDYLRDVNAQAVKIGFPNQAMYQFPHTSMMTLLMEVEEIFEQTPKVGAGKKVIV